jgi:hypothetical protein
MDKYQLQEKISQTEHLVEADIHPNADVSLAV